MLVSLALSLVSAWSFAWLEFGRYLLIVIAFLSEPTKIVANRVLWSPWARRSSRFWAAVWYLACVAASATLLHLLVEHGVSNKLAVADAAKAEQTAAGADVDRRLLEARADLKAALEDAERARSEVVPGLRSLAELTRKLDAKDRPAPRDVKALKEDKAKVERNMQLEASAARHEATATALKVTVAELAAERSRTFTKQPLDPIVQNVQNVQNVLFYLSIAAALLIEAAISGGIWADQFYNSTPTVNSSSQKSVQDRSAGSRDELNDQNDPERSKTMPDRRFEEWLEEQWRRHRSRDGWLENTQQAWADAAGVSGKSFVHAQLERLARSGRIEKVAHARRTRIRFLRVARLRPVE